MDLLLAAVLLLQDPTAERLVEELRSDDINARNKASEQLLKLGKPAIPALEKASKDADPDLSRSSQELLRKITDTLSALAVREALRSGMEKQAKGDLDGALAAFTQAIELHPKVVDAWLARSSARQAKGDNVGALADYTKALEIVPDNALSCRLRGDARTARGDLRGAIEDHTQALELDPKFVSAYWGRGIARQTMGDWNGAVNDFTQGLEIDPTHAEAYGHRGFAKINKGDADGGIADCSRALELDPKLTQAWSNRGWAKAGKSDFDGAIADCTRALELDPKLIFACNNRGYARASKGDFDGAIEDSTRVLEMDPNNFFAHGTRGFARVSKGDNDGAIADCNRTLELNPRYFWAYNNRAWARVNKGDYDGAIEDCTRTLELDPQHFWAYNNRGWAKSHKNDYDGAIEDYNHAIEINPKLTRAYSNRGWAWVNKGDYERAIADHTRSIELDPQKVNGYNDRGNAKKAKGDLEGALADFTQALTLDPKSEWTYYHRGCLRYETQAWDEALTDFRKAVGKDASLLDYTRIRIYLVRSRQGEGVAAKAALAKFRKKRPANKAGDWQDRMLAFLTGELGEKEFLEAAPPNDSGKKCEVYFYAGIHRLIAGEKDQAAELLRKCLETGQKGYFEYFSARADLEALLAAAPAQAATAEPLRIVIIGDSTVCEYPADKPERGWGMFLEAGFKPGTVKAINLAKSGRSTKTFIKEGLWDKALKEKPDLVLIQFGHNDSHAKERPESTDAATDYKEYLRRYLDEARAVGATPILVTPMQRRTFRPDGTLSDSLKPYADAMKEVAAEKKAPLIDLHKSSGELFAKLGEKASADFANQPGDRTHFNEMGAKAMADLVMKELPTVELRLKPRLK